MELLPVVILEGNNLFVRQGKLSV